MAIEASMLGAAHALANPLTAVYNVVHGQAVGVMLPHVIRFNGATHPEWYAELLADIDPAAAADVMQAPHRLAEHIHALLHAAGLKTQLSDLAVEQDRLNQLADSAAKQWTGTLTPSLSTQANSAPSTKRLYRRPWSFLCLAKRPPPPATLPNLASLPKRCRTPFYDWLMDRTKFTRSQTSCSVKPTSDPSVFMVAPRIGVPSIPWMMRR